LSGVARGRSEAAMRPARQMMVSALGYARAPAHGCPEGAGLRLRRPPSRRPRVCARSPVLARPALAGRAVGAVSSGRWPARVHAIATLGRARCAASSLPRWPVSDTGRDNYEWRRCAANTRGVPTRAKSCRARASGMRGRRRWSSPPICCRTVSADGHVGFAALGCRRWGATCASGLYAAISRSITQASRPRPRGTRAYGPALSCVSALAGRLRWLARGVWRGWMRGGARPRSAAGMTFARSQWCGRKSIRDMAPARAT